MKRIGLILLALSLSACTPDVCTADTTQQSHHILAEYNQCNAEKLDDKTFLEELMLHLLNKHQFNVLGSTFHQFEPQGVTGVILLSESHASIHTWPEDGYAAVDFFTCGEVNPEVVEEELRVALECKTVEKVVMKRRPSITVQKHLKP